MSDNQKYKTPVGLQGFCMISGEVFYASAGRII